LNQADNIESVEIDRTARSAVDEHAQREFPYECCGILIGRRHRGRIRVGRVVPSENIAEGNRFTNYQIDWKTLLETRRSLRGEPCEIVGFYHSHPDGTARPSRRDEEFVWAEHVYLIVPVLRGKVGFPGAWYAGTGFDCLKEIQCLRAENGQR